MVQEKAKVTEKITWTTYCRTCNAETIQSQWALTFLEWHPDIPQLTGQITRYDGHNSASGLKAPTTLSAQEEGKSLLENRGQTHTLRELFDINLGFKNKIHIRKAAKV